MRERSTVNNVKTYFRNHRIRTEMNNVYREKSGQTECKPRPPVRMKRYADMDVCSLKREVVKVHGEFLQQGQSR